MHVIPGQQGTELWHEHRKNNRNASDAPVVLGCSPCKTRTQFLDEKTTGITPEVDAATQRRFDDGHRVESLARPLAEDIVGEELFPCVGLSDDVYLSASFDGITLLEEIGFEHKLLSKRLRDAMPEGVTGADLPEDYRVQMEQQAAVSGCEKILFMASEWNDDVLVEERHCWYYPDSDLRKRLLAGWSQFDKDLESHEVSAPEVAGVGNAPGGLPALTIQVSGNVVESNLDQFKAHALSVFDGIKTELQTDQDFLDAEATVRFCKNIEKRLDNAKDAALNQTADIYTLFNAIDEIKESARQKRLELDKLVKAEKESRKRDILRDAEHDYDAHLEAIGRELESASGQVIKFPAPHPGIQEAMKGKRAITSLRDAANTAVANAKIDADQAARGIRDSIKALQESAKGHESLFPDGGQLVVSKSADDLRNLAKARIAEHEEQERNRLEAERERIRAEEQAKAERQQEEMQRQRAEAERQQEQAKAQTEPVSAPDKPQPAPTIPMAANPVTPRPAPYQKPERPDDMAIIRVVAEAFNVDHGTARDWIAEINVIATA